MKLLLRVKIKSKFQSESYQRAIEMDTHLGAQGWQFIGHPKLGYLITDTSTHLYLKGNAS